MSDTLLWQRVLQVAEAADLREQVKEAADLKGQVNHPETGLAAVSSTMAGLQQQVSKHVMSLMPLSVLSVRQTIE